MASVMVCWVIGQLVKIGQIDENTMWSGPRSTIRIILLDRTIVWFSLNIEALSVHWFREKLIYIISTQ